MRILMVLLMALVISIGCAGTQVKHQDKDDLTSHMLDAGDLLYKKYPHKSHIIRKMRSFDTQTLYIIYELVRLSCRERAQWVLNLEKELKEADPI